MPRTHPMAGTVPAGCRAAPGTMHPLPPRRGERLGTALLPCWQQGHLHTASVPHGGKFSPWGSSLGTQRPPRRG